VFDPFFTTKPSGTGLGLSICHELVQAHGGDIQLESEEGRGTSVKITIPAGQV
jgi:two-component system sensor histidine kinase AtoS